MLLCREKKGDTGAGNTIIGGRVDRLPVLPVMNEGATIILITHSDHDTFTTGMSHHPTTRLTTITSNTMDTETHDTDRTRTIPLPQNMISQNVIVQPLLIVEEE